MNTLVIDGNNLLHRTFWVSNSLSQSNPITLFLQSFKKMYKDLGATDAIFTWDKKLTRDKVSFRKLICNEYKGTRDQEYNKDVYEHESDIRKIISTLGFRNILPGSLEADDVMYWLSRNIKRGNITIATADSDMHQLVNNRVSVYDLNKKKTITLSNFESITGYRDVIEYKNIKALTGDKSDNISGIKKCGPKTARKLLAAGLDNLDSEYKAIFERNKQLIFLENGIKNHPDEEALYTEQLNNHPERDLDGFTRLLERSNAMKIRDNITDWQSTFFDVSLNNAAADCIALLFSNGNS